MLLSTLELHDIYPLNDNRIGKLHTKFVHYPPSLSNNQSSEFSSLHQFFPSINYYYFHPLSSILKMFPSSSPSIGNWNIYSLSKSSFIHSLESRDKRIDCRDTAVTVTLRWRSRVFARQSNIDAITGEMYLPRSIGGPFSFARRGRRDSHTLCLEHAIRRPPQPASTSNEYSWCFPWIRNQPFVSFSLLFLLLYLCSSVV